MLKRRLLLIPAVALLFFVGWLLLRMVLPPAFPVATPTRGPAVQAVYATGTVEATVMLPIAPRNTARLMELLVDEGSNVEKDQLLAQLEDEDLDSALAELQAREIYAQKEYQRQAALVKRGFASRDARDRAQSEWDAAKAAVERAKAQANFMKLQAPADGRIIRRDGEVGELIPANQPVFWMSCCAPLRITSEVDEEDIALVQPGQKVLIRADAFPGEAFHGTVQSITPKGDPIARSYRVRISFMEDVPLLIGMTAETNIIVHETKDALLIPASALHEDSVWIVKDGTAHKQKIVVGAKDAQQVEVREGISADTQIITGPTEKLEEGLSVRTTHSGEGSD